MTPMRWRVVFSLASTATGAIWAGWLAAASSRALEQPDPDAANDAEITIATRTSLRMVATVPEHQGQCHTAPRAPRCRCCLPGVRADRGHDVVRDPGLHRSVSDAERRGAAVRDRRRDPLAARGADPAVAARPHVGLARAGRRVRCVGVLAGLSRRGARPGRGGRRAVRYEDTAPAGTSPLSLHGALDT